MHTPKPDPTAEQSREEMVRQLVNTGAARDPRVVDAFRAVPRHLAVPEVTLAKVYDAEFAAVTKSDDTGVQISSVSAARIQAMQIEQAEIKPGMRVLEIGSGGPNAAYLAEMVGPEGEVVSIDIDPEVTARAERFVKATGYRNITVLTGDAEDGAPEQGVFDRIVVTVQAADIPPAWLAQLAPQGRLVVPLRMRGMTRTVAFVRDGEQLVSADYQLCGFVPMQGAGEDRVRLFVLHDAPGEEVALRVDGHPDPDTSALARALAMPGQPVWSGVTLAGGESFDPAEFWLMSALDNLPLMAATLAAREKGLIANASPLGVPTLVEGGSFAYRATRATADPDRWELGAIGHGPQGERLAERMAEEFRTWDRDHRDQMATITVNPADMPDDRLSAGRLITRRHSRITITWP